MVEIDADTLLPNDRLRAAVQAGEMTQIHRGGETRYATVGDTFTIDDTTYRITDVTERTLGDMTDADARREGSDSLAAYKERLVRVHPGGFEWDDASAVTRYRFEARE